MFFKFDKKKQERHDRIMELLKENEDIYRESSRIEPLPEIDPDKQKPKGKNGKMGKPDGIFAHPPKIKQAGN